MLSITADEVRAYMAANDCGLLEARARLKKERRQQALHNMRLRAGELYTVEACRDVIVDLLELLKEIHA